MLKRFDAGIKRKSIKVFNFLIFEFIFSIVTDVKTVIGVETNSTLGKN
jgi:hypothetical protein